MIVTLAGCSSTAHPRTTAGGRITMSEDDRAQLYGVRRRQRTSTGLARKSVRVHGAFSRMRCRGSSERTTMQRELHRMGGADYFSSESREPSWQACSARGCSPQSKGCERTQFLRGAARKLDSCAGAGPGSTVGAVWSHVSTVNGKWYRRRWVGYAAARVGQVRWAAAWSSQEDSLQSFVFFQ